MSERQVETTRGRSFASAFPHETWDDVQRGVMRSVYRRIPCFKSPFDLGLYLLYCLFPSQ